MVLHSLVRIIPTLLLLKEDYDLGINKIKSNDISNNNDFFRFYLEITFVMALKVSRKWFLELPVHHTYRVTYGVHHTYIGLYIISKYLIWLRLNISTWAEIDSG